MKEGLELAAGVQRRQAAEDVAFLPGAKGVPMGGGCFGQVYQCECAPSLRCRLRT